MRTPRRGKRLLQAYFFVLQTCWMQNTSAYPGPVCEGGEEGEAGENLCTGKRTGEKEFLSVCAGTIKRHGCFAAEKAFQKKGSLPFRIWERQKV